MSADKIDRVAPSRSVAVIKLRYLGDVLLATPVAAVVKADSAHARVLFVVWERSAVVLRGNPDIDRVVTIRESFPGSVVDTLSAIRALRREGLDAAIDLTGNDRSSLLARLSGAKIRIGYPTGKPGRDAAVYTDLLPPGDPDLHQIDRNLASLAPLGIIPIPAEPRMAVASADEASVGAALAAAGAGDGPIAVLHPGARRWYKSWPPERFAALADRLAEAGIRPVLAGAREDREACEVIVGRMKTPALNLCGKTTIGELAALCRRAAVFVGNDSGPLHIAAAVGAPTVGFFGLTNWKNWAPRGEKHVALRRDCVCAPYGHKKECDQGGKRCLSQIEVREALDAIAHMTRGNDRTF